MQKQESIALKLFFVLRSPSKVYLRTFTHTYIFKEISNLKLNVNVKKKLFLFYEKKISYMYVSIYIQTYTDL